MAGIILAQYPFSNTILPKILAGTIFFVTIVHYVRRAMARKRSDWFVSATKLAAEELKTSEQRSDLPDWFVSAMKLVAEELKTSEQRSDLLHIPIKLYDEENDWSHTFGVTINLAAYIQEDQKFV